MARMGLPLHRIVRVQRVCQRHADGLSVGEDKPSFLRVRENEPAGPARRDGHRAASALRPRPKEPGGN